ncbi:MULTISPECIES: GNAT family N-acetyltransferase [unclassified Pseudomonas]|uniref:GNAT family N-acetyltransferase n=1 Tax=unclassified Pseudomonas TaxID=196821 RepID=UPI002096AF58|nr:MULTISPECIES: GNAT family N-acetyltransferase [unclassified Pseudomonas]MCO7521855.1 GNAT family N-acetyltransferase [Pseudomonas sp. 1]MCO7538757.1 GNAT family N-acetyltransferase [Pseudomonas sp. VA159-2]
MAVPIELLQTGPEHADLVRNLYQFYAYESSDWEQEDIEADGRFYIHEPHFQRYWQSADWSASLILVDGFIAGFVLVERSELPGIDALELADLFVLKKYRRLGVGQAVARQFLSEGPHDWLLRCHGDDAPALAFCQAVVADLSRPVREIALDDEPQLRSYWVTQRLH